MDRTWIESRPIRGATFTSMSIPEDTILVLTTYLPSGRMARRELMMTLATGQNKSEKWQVMSDQHGMRAASSRHLVIVTRHSGFTLIELILVLALLAIIT